MRCAACRHHNPEDSLFCESCGSPVSRRCTSCGDQISTDARYCSRCGALQEANELRSVGSVVADRENAPRGEYRHLTVLFCDLVGSTELSERLDPEDLRDLMHEYQSVCREALEAYEGHIAQYRGDGVLAYFGFPQSHEDDAERAVRGALELQRRLHERFEQRQVKARIGVHTGQVIIGEMGSETLAHGSSMNLAARIEAEADAGGVAISGVTQGLTSGLFVTRDLGAYDLKGIQHPVRIYAVDRVLGGRRPRPDTVRGLIGRDRDLGLLGERFELASEGNGQVVLVSGEAGIGKSQLTLALREEVSAIPHIWIDMQCSPFISGSALRPVIDLFEERVGRRDGDPAEQRSEFLAKGLAETPGLDAGRVLPYLFSLLGLPQLDRYPMPTITPELQRERTMESLCAIVEALTGQQTVVIETEDLHWADPSTLEFLGRLVEVAPATRMLLLCTARPEFELPWHRSHVEHLQLARLPHRYTLKMIESVAAGRRLPMSVAERIAERSDGVPLFIEELTRTVLDPEALGDRGSQLGRRESFDQLTIPMTLKGSLMERLDRLSSAKRVAQLGATIGHDFSYELIEKVGEVTPQALRSGLAQLVEAEILYERGTPSDTSYVFRHILLQDTAYHSQLRSDRRQTHARVAAVLERDFAELVAAEPWVMAHHCAEAGLHDEAATSYQAAAALAAGRYANEEALGYTDAVLVELSNLPDDVNRRERELTARLTMTSPLVAIRGFAHAEVEALHDQISGLCDRGLDGPQALPGLLALARYYQRRGDPRKAAVVGDSILRTAKDVGIPLFEVVGHLIIGASEITIAEAPRAIAHLERAVEVGLSIDLPPAATPLEPELLSFILAIAGIALASGGYPDRAAARAREARERAFQQDHELTVVHVLALSTITHYMLEDYETTLAWGGEVLELSRDRGFHASEAQARTNLGWARVALGDSDGLADVEAGLAHAIDSGFLGGVCEYVQAAADANRLAGRYARAHELLDRCERIYETTGEGICFEGRGRRARAMTYLDEGVPEKAEAEFEWALESLTRYAARLECLMVATELLRLARGRADERGARERVAALYAEFDGEHEICALKAARSLLEETADVA